MHKKHKLKSIIFPYDLHGFGNAEHLRPYEYQAYRLGELDLERKV